MANEFPPSDIRNVWQNQKPEGNLALAEEIPKRICQLDKKIRRRSRIGFALCFFVIAYFSCLFLIFPSVIQRIGDLLSILGAGYLVYELRLDQVQKKKAEVSAAKMGNAASVDYYRAELQRQRDFHCGIWFWSRLVIFVPGPLVFMVGLQLAYPVLAIYMCWVEAAFLFFAGLGIPLNLRLAHKYQKQIEELDSVRCFT